MNKHRRTGLSHGLVRTALWAMEGINHLLWPAVCCNCGLSICKSQDSLCSDCWHELMMATAGDYCHRCGRDASKYGQIDSGCADCQDREIHFDRIARGGVYNGTLRSMILAFKFRDRTELSGKLVHLLDAALAGSGFAGDIDIFVPVPLHWRRRFVRGYNQSLVLCKELGKFSASMSTELLRIRYTQWQWGLTPAGRKRNVAGAFAVRRGHGFAGKNICLIDDITTSQATLNECAKTLKQAGAKKVFALAVAVAMQH